MATSMGGGPTGGGDIGTTGAGGDLGSTGVTSESVGGGYTGGYSGGYDYVPQEEHTTETRRSTSTSEFYVFLVLAVVIVFFGYESGRDSFARDDAWRYVTWLGVAYLISRGLAKAGVYEAYMRDRDRGRDS